jgi:hypothetical protein
MKAENYKQFTEGWNAHARRKPSHCRSGSEDRTFRRKGMFTIRVSFFEFLKQMHWLGSSALINSKWQLSWWTSRFFWNPA